MDRRKFVVHSGIVGAGLGEANTAAPGVLHAAEFKFSLHIGGKTRGIYRTPFAVPV
jgi:hypothetical protein